MTTSRRVFLASTALTGCAFARGEARLRTRPSSSSNAVPGVGLRGLGIRKNRDAQLYVPAAVAESGKPAPFLIYLHGAGGDERQGITRLQKFADSFGFVLLSPASAGPTWDAIREGYGPDVRMLDSALTRAFEICQVDAKRIGVCGFSDGASYALGLGLANGELFQSVMAWSPGMLPPGFEEQGKPRVFVSHGTNDPILPIDACSRVMVPDLKRRGYKVTYREFEGVHTVPREVCEESLRWFIG